MAGLYAMALLVSMVLSTACNNAGDQDGDGDDEYTAYRGYVVSVRDTSDRYYDRDWTELEREYNEKKAKVEAKADRMDEKSKAEYNQLDADWQAFKGRYEERRTQRDGEARLTKLRGDLVASPSDMTFGSLQGADILPAYDRFIETVRANRESYTTQDWNEVNVIYNALKARRQAVMNDIPKADKMRVQNLEIEYETKVMVNKPFSEDGNDNTDNK